MTQTQTLIARGVLGLACCIATAIAPGLRFNFSATKERFDRMVVAAFVLSRLVLYSLVFFVLHLAPRGDVPSYYFPQALEILKGHLPYRDFISSYAPLHAFMDAGAVFLWRTPLAIILLTLFAEFIAFPVWIWVARAALPESSDRTIRIAALLYLFSPVSMQFVTVDGQNNVIISLMIGLALYLALRSRAVASGVFVGLAISLVKFLPLIYIPTFFVVLRRRWVWVVACLSLIAAIYAGFLLVLHVPVFQPLTEQGQLAGTANIYYAVESIFGFHITGRTADIFLLVTYAGALAFIWKNTSSAVLSPGAAPRSLALTEKNRDILLYGIALCTLVFLVFSKKSWPPYAMMTLFPICLLPAAGKRWSWLFFGVFGIVCMLEPSYAASIMSFPTDAILHSGILAHQPRALIMIGLEIGLILSYLWLISLSIRQIRRTSLPR